MKRESARPTPDSGNPLRQAPRPRLSTASVPAKFAIIMPRHRRETFRTSANRKRSFPSRTTDALSRTTSVPEPIATPTFASSSAGASLIPSPTIATFLPCARKFRMHLTFPSGSNSESTSSTPRVLAIASPTSFRSPVSSTVRHPIARISRIAAAASGRRTSTIRIDPTIFPPCATRTSE